MNVVKIGKFCFWSWDVSFTQGTATSSFLEKHKVLMSDSLVNPDNRRRETVGLINLLTHFDEFAAARTVQDADSCLRVELNFHLDVCNQEHHSDHLGKRRDLSTAASQLSWRKREEKQCHHLFLLGPLYIGVVLQAGNRWWYVLGIRLVRNAT